MGRGVRAGRHDAASACELAVFAAAVRRRPRRFARARPDPPPRGVRWPPMRRLVVVLVIAVAAAAAVLRTGGEKADGPAASEAAVVRVVDGDTIAVRVGGRAERVRYIGVDTPESVKPGTPVQCFAHAAAAENARLVAGERVRLVRDVEARDRFGRLLAYVYRMRDGRFVNAELVRRGYARTLTIPPNVRFASRFAGLARGARAAGRGLWNAC
jgi:micrococcal nuclease